MFNEYPLCSEHFSFIPFLFSNTTHLSHPRESRQLGITIVIADSSIYDLTHLVFQHHIFESKCDHRVLEVFSTTSKKSRDSFHHLIKPQLLSTKVVKMGSGAPPRGPKGSTPSSRPSRGGIQKRKAGPTKVDKDGDLVMDAANTIGADRKGKGRPEGASKPSKGRATIRQPTSTGPARSGLNNIRTQQAIIRGLGSQTAGLESRVTTRSGDRSRVRSDDGGFSYLSIRGLRQSKAASNPDGGVGALLGFLERKASGLDANLKKGVQIKKVSLL